MAQRKLLRYASFEYSCLCFPSRLSIEQSKGKKLYELFGLEILASKVGAQNIAQTFVQGKVSFVYSLKLLHSGEFKTCKVFG